MGTLDGLGPCGRMGVVVLSFSPSFLQVNKAGRSRHLVSFSFLVYIGGYNLDGKPIKRLDRIASTESIGKVVSQSCSKAFGLGLTEEAQSYCV